jgi:hypothetical protein
MRKFVAAMVGIGAMLVSAIPAEAQHYQRRHDHRYAPAPRYYAQPRRVAPAPRYYAQPRYNAPRYARPRNNWAPYAIGGLVLGAIVGNYFYNQYGELCRNEVMDYDYRGAPLTGTVCE